jgi:hypothetical protein
MGQHPTPDPDPDEDELEALGTRVYEGSGLSVRALTAEELQQFLNAHQAQPGQPLGSGWAALDPEGHPHGVPRTPPGVALSPPDPWRRSRPGPSPARWAALAAPPSPSIGAAAPPSWPAGHPAWPGGHRWSPPPACSPAPWPPRPASR